MNFTEFLKNIYEMDHVICFIRNRNGDIATIPDESGIGRAEEYDQSIEIIFDETDITINILKANVSSIINSKERSSVTLNDGTKYIFSAF